MMTALLVIGLAIFAGCALMMTGVLLAISFEDCGIHLKENDDEIL